MKYTGSVSTVPQSGYKFCPAFLMQGEDGDVYVQVEPDRWLRLYHHAGGGLVEDPDSRWTEADLAGQCAVPFVGILTITADDAGEGS